MNTPTTYQAGELMREGSNWPTTEHPSGMLGPARPLGLSGLYLFRRIKAAWAVFTGRADVLRWDADTMKIRIDELNEDNLGLLFQGQDD